MQSTLNSTEAASKILVVSHDSALLCMLWSKEVSRSWVLEVVSSPWEAMDKIQSSEKPDLLLLDVSQENGEGLHILRWLRRLRATMPIMVVGHSCEADIRAELISTGASACVDNPFEEGVLEQAIAGSLAPQSQRLEAEISSDEMEPLGGGRFFIGASADMRRLREQASLLAQSNAPVLILGERGSGKGTFGRLIHQLSIRSALNYGVVNCAALPGDMLMKELLGFRSSNPSVPSRVGKMELCAKGTILLREITEIPLSLQDQLLDVLKNRRYIIPGSNMWCETDVRIMATSSADMGRAIAEKRLRQEFYIQLSHYTVHVPPLRKRTEEIPFLAMHFMHRLSNHYGLPSREFPPEVLASFQQQQWPGNFRELEYRVKRYLMLGDLDLSMDETRNEQREATEAGNGLGIEKNQSLAANQQKGVNGGSKSLRSLVQSVKSEAEKRAIMIALEKTGWNRKATARLLKVSYRTVLYKIQQYQLSRVATPQSNGSSNGLWAQRDESLPVRNSGPGGPG